MKQKKATKVYIFLGILVLLIIGFVVYMVYAQRNLENLVAQPGITIDLTTIPDGTYEGFYDAFPITVSLIVTMQSHQIEAIEILQHGHGQGADAENIVEDVLAQQRLDVDAIAGATYSSKVILKAIEDALTP